MGFQAPYQSCSYVHCSLTSLVMQAVPQPLSTTLVSLFLAAMCATVGSATVVVAAFLRSLLCVTRGGGSVMKSEVSKDKTIGEGFYCAQCFSPRSQIAGCLPVDLKSEPAYYVNSEGCDKDTWVSHSTALLQMKDRVMPIRALLLGPQGKCFPLAWMNRSAGSSSVCCHSLSGVVMANTCLQPWLD